MPAGARLSLPAPPEGAVCAPAACSESPAACWSWQALYYECVPIILSDALLPAFSELLDWNTSW